MGQIEEVLVDTFVELLGSTVSLFTIPVFHRLVRTTTYGIMDHEEARRKHVGGKIVGFFF